MDAVPRPPVMAGDITPGIGIVAPDPVAEAEQHLLDQAGRTRGAGGAVRVAQHHVGRIGGLRGMGGHGMAVDQQADAEARAGFGDQFRQRGVIGLPAGADARLGLGEGEATAIDRLPRGDDARDRSEAGTDAGAGRVHPGRQRRVEHAGVEFPGFAVHVAPYARKGRRDQRGAVIRRGGEEFVDEGILAPAQRQRREARLRHQFGRVVLAGMRGGEDDRHGLPHGTADDIGRGRAASGDTGCGQIHRERRNHRPRPMSRDARGCG